MPPSPLCTMSQWCMLKAIADAVYASQIMHCWASLQDDPVREQCNEWCAASGGCPQVLYLWIKGRDAIDVTSYLKRAVKVAIACEVAGSRTHIVKIMRLSATSWQQYVTACEEVRGKTICYGCVRSISGQDTRIKFQKCGACKVARYCSPQCQKAHWPKHIEACDMLKQSC